MVRKVFTPSSWLALGKLSDKQNLDLDIAFVHSKAFYFKLHCIITAKTASETVVRLHVCDGCEESEVQTFLLHCKTKQDKRSY